MRPNENGLSYLTRPKKSEVEIENFQKNFHKVKKLHIRMVLRLKSFGFLHFDRIFSTAEIRCAQRARGCLKIETASFSYA
jgi:hypothetical protein